MVSTVKNFTILEIYMRVISGKYKGRKLAEFEGKNVRPTSDRAKEGVFSVLQFEIAGKSFYDGFCGSGAMGIEALSRGAKEVVFTDSSLSSCNLTKKNLKLIGENSSVINSDCVSFLRSCRNKFDIIFLDPPYASKEGLIALEVIAKREILNDNGIVIMESGSAVNRVIEGLFIEKRKKYGIAEFVFYRKANLKTAVFAGSFDPVTKGHVHIVEKALAHFDKIIVAQGINENKKYQFDFYTRLNMLNLAFEDNPKVSVTSFDGLLVDFLKENKVVYNVRGIRDEKDMLYEENMYKINKEAYPEIVNFYISADEDMKSVSSTYIKEEIKNGKDVSSLVPEKSLKVLLKSL